MERTAQTGRYTELHLKLIGRVVASQREGVCRDRIPTGGHLRRELEAVCKSPVENRCAKPTGVGSGVGGAGVGFATITADVDSAAIGLASEPFSATVVLSRSHCAQSPRSSRSRRCFICGSRFSYAAAASASGVMLRELWKRQRSSRRRRCHYVAHTDQQPCNECI